ncbi:MAG: hypothetical protein NZ891_04780, partial [bacterium]|nr:hypothetical protein [bacterium]MDW8164039.1 hypothetical protein [Candidatus Omnitrophota bacterium]
MVNERLKEIEKEYKSYLEYFLKEKRDQDKVKEVIKKISLYEEILKLKNKYDEILKKIEEDQEIIKKSGDKELIRIAEEELKLLNI